MALHQACPICAWINPETDEKETHMEVPAATRRMLKHLMDVHYEKDARHQPWEDKVFTVVRIDE